MLTKLKELSKKLVPTKRTVLAIAGIIILASIVIKPSKQKNDIRSASVMIVTRAQNSGGTGIILQSTPTSSTILTNDHVCRAIKNGGVVKSVVGDYQINSIIESEVSDLCLVQVLADLGVNTSLANQSPKLYDKASVSGHPALMPNVISTGHFSGRTIIQVMIGFKKCTEADLAGPNGLACAFFGGLPVIKSYESVLVTATIMPGSSGSGVYNEDQELAGVVFAGSNGFGYAWTVPYEQVLNFLYAEHQTLKIQVIDQSVLLGSPQEDNARLKSALSRCSEAEDEVIQNLCTILQRDSVVR